MIEVHQRLFVGSAQDYETQIKGRAGWAVVQAAKEPYHRAALGYSGRAADKSHPEYLVARRGNVLILNLVDAADAKYFPASVMAAAIDFIADRLGAGFKVLVHCNQGCSRSPSIALFYLRRETETPYHTLDFAAAEARFAKLYPPYAPTAGVRGFVRAHW